MSLFESLNISGSGIDAAQTWINTASGNIANADDVVAVGQSAYGAEAPVFTPVPAGGSAGEAVQVSSIQVGSTAGLMTQDPTSPLADAQGNVLTSDVSLSSQLVGLVAAQSDYQANTTALSQAKTAYQSALTLGQ
jgi:flagellar basal-body rod protein FlgC